MNLEISNEGYDSEWQPIAEIADQMASLLQLGQPVDLEQLVRRYPPHEQAIRDTYEALTQVYRVRQNWAPESSQRHEPLPPRFVVGDYRIVRELGRGGMGVVYEAEQLSLGRRVALKVLPFAALLDERQLRRFQTEARAAAILQHDNIVSVYSVGCERGVHYYAMKLIDGPSLAEVIARVHSPPLTHEKEVDPSIEPLQETSPIGSLSTQKSEDRDSFHRSIAKLGIQVAKALRHAHEEGVVHRDIKPANLLIDAEGRIHVADFGLARIHQSPADITRSGDMLGTLRYMSPEQIAGDRPVDARSDIHSLGTTLYEALVGQAAYVGNDRQQLIRSVMEKEPVALRKLDSQMPHDLATVVHKAMSKDASERYQSADAFADDLQRFVDNRAIAARPITRFYRIAKFVQRNPVVTTLFASTVALLMMLSVGSAGVAWKFAQDASIQRAEARRQTLGVYARDMRLVRLALDEGDIVEAERKLLKWVPDKSDIESAKEVRPEDYRGFEWYHLWQRCHDPAIEHTISHKLLGIDVAFSPDGSKLADGFFTQVVPVWSIGDSKPVLSRKLRIHSVAPSVTKTIGDWLFVGTGRGRLFVWDWASETLIADIDTDATDGEVQGIDFDAEQRLIAIGIQSPDDNSSVMVWDLDRGEFIVTTDGPDGLPYVAFGLDDKLLVASSGGKSIRIIDPHTGKVIGERHFDGETARVVINQQRTKLALAINRDKGDLINAQVVVAELSNGEIHESRRIELGSVRIKCLDFSDDEQELAVGDYDGQLHRINLAKETVNSKRLHFGPVNSVKYSPDGRRLATTGWDCQTHLLLRHDSPHAQPLITRLQAIDTEIGLHVDFLDHGQTVCSSNGPNQIDLWDAFSGEIQETVDLPEGPWNCIHFGADRDRERLAIARSNWPPQDVADEVVIWNRDSGLGAKHFRIPEGVITLVVPFSPDGRYVGVTGPGHATLIDLVDESTRKIEFPGWVKGCAFSNDGQIFAVAPTKGPVHFYDIETLGEVRTSIVMDSISTGCIRYAPQGNILASTGFEGRFNLCDVATGQRLQVGERCPRYLATLDFSPDGSRIATGAMDGRVRMFSTETGDELFSIDVEKYYSYVSFSSDGQALAIVSGRDRLVVQAPDQGNLARLSRAQLGDIICRDITFYERPNPHAAIEKSE